MYIQQFIRIEYGMLLNLLELRCFIDLELRLLEGGWFV